MRRLDLDMNPGPSGAAVVIGAGIGGLATAIRLQAAGVETTLLDRNSRPGGKLNLIEADGYRFDTGPSLLTMPEVFNELFEAAGLDFHRELDLVKLDPYCRYFFEDGSMLETSDSIERTSRGLMDVSPRDLDAFFRFLARASALYRSSIDSVIDAPPLDWKRMRGSKINPVEFFRMRPFQQLGTLIEREFRDERIRRICRLISLYTGCAPDRTPAVFALIPFLEFGLGRWYVIGGLYRIAEVLIRRFVELGGSYRPSVRVTEVAFEGGRARRAITSDGESIEAAAFVVNADVATACETFLGNAPGAAALRSRLLKLRRSTSAFVLMIGSRADVSKYIHHNILFSHDEKKEWREIFETGVPPSEPTIYLNNPSFSDPTVAPERASALFAMVNVPPSDPATFDWEREAGRYEDRVLDILQRHVPEIRTRMDVLYRRTPLDLRDLTYADRGSLYGRAPESLGAMMKRPRNREPGFDGITFVGGTTHPGAGIPLAALSGKLVAGMVLKDLSAGSTASS